ncbi:MAG TPA: DUF4105 domain-containing protein, partial [Bacteroidales bacterium]|nr:DUF4105 domain-containing protein [Bacteroidales bacterium]
MMKKIFFGFILIISILHLQAQRLSEAATASILSCGAGNELYVAFGHTAIRLCDTNKHLDLVFNYGTFDFNTPNFYLKFSQGRLPYMLSISSFDGFMHEYQREGRWIYEQELNLTLEEKEKLYNLLIENYLPQNRFYAYDFFLDNCATRVRDIIDSSLIDRNLFHKTNNKENENVSFRKLIYPYMESMQWWRLGIDIALGMRCDKAITDYQYMFLPTELMAQLDTTQIEGESFVKTKKMLLAESKPALSKNISPLLVTSILCLIVIALTLWEIKKKVYFKAVDIVLFSLVTILSLLIIYLWFFSDHYFTKYNFNLLWANPL